MGTNELALVAQKRTYGRTDKVILKGYFAPEEKSRCERMYLSETDCSAARVPHQDRDVGREVVRAQDRHL